MLRAKEQSKTTTFLGKQVKERRVPMAEREGAKRDGSKVTVGDFIFEGYKLKKYVWGLFGDSWKKDKKGYENRVLELMAKHYEFYKQFQKEDEYVKKDSILFCNQGTHLTKFDMLKDRRFGRHAYRNL